MKMNSLHPDVLYAHMDTFDRSHGHRPGFLQAEVGKLQWYEDYRKNCLPAKIHWWLDTGLMVWASICLMIGAMYPSSARLWFMMGIWGTAFLFGLVVIVTLCHWWVCRGLSREIDRKVVEEFDQSCKYLCPRKAKSR